ncbi:type VI secretion system tube protein TssD [Aquimarina sp. 2201CG5-10]|uniref:type VI secretion system tube protein TssD n=1 Tax=Aquimarina callyspongiae TaxID=3098150 RepID=UPI002AB35229|nr:type VI secretion system tube protein TssD [Aquimarina sp. 2201CG5-10]MDY8138339.1 type VI secretion system tube protein TssD [Aquimarina sp. 2201CG5-10]
MSFNATLEIDGKNFTVLSFNYQTKQEVDVTGRPSSVNRAGMATFTLELSKDADLFSSWAFDSYLMKTVTVKYEKRDTKATQRTITFDHAYLVKFSENFESTGSIPATITCTISAQKLTAEADVHENNWV